jgi:hypothetical protein
MTNELSVAALSVPHVLHRQPGAGRDNQRFNTGLECGMENWREFWAVVHRKFVEPICLFCPRVSLRIGAADEPENRRNVPFGSK